VPQSPPGRCVRTNTSTTKGFGPPASRIFAPQVSDFWIASFSIGVSIVRTGVAFWNFAPVAQKLAALASSPLRSARSQLDFERDRQPYTPATTKAQR